MSNLDRNYAGAAARVAINAPMTDSSPSDGDTFTVTGVASGYPTANFVVVLSRGNSDEEKIFCSGRSGSTFTVGASGRGFDGTIASNHGTSTGVEHILDAAAMTRLTSHVNDDELDDHPQYLNETRHEDTALHHAGTSIPVAAPVAATPGDTQSAGSGNNLARSNHRHAMLPFGAGDPTDVAIAGTADAGAADEYSRSDHAHAGPGWAHTGDILGVDLANDGGALDIPARGDHVHRLTQAAFLARYGIVERGMAISSPATISASSQGGATNVAHTNGVVVPDGALVKVTGLVDLEFTDFAGGTTAIVDLFVDGVADGRQIIYSIQPESGGPNAVTRLTIGRTWAFNDASGDHDLDPDTYDFSLRVWRSGTGDAVRVFEHTHIITEVIG